MAARKLRVIDSDAPAAEEDARERRNRLARERRAAKKKAELAEAKAKAERKLTLAEAIEEGNYLEILRAQRREAVRDLPTTTGPAKAAMHRQIAILSKEIAGLEAAQTEGTDIGDAIEAEDEEFDPEAD